MNKKPWLTIIGVGDDGWNGLSCRQQEHIATAQHIFGGERHLGFLPSQFRKKAKKWPSPFMKGIDEVLALNGQNVVVLSSGDPMFFGAGATFLRKLPVDDVLVLPHPSSFSLAAARLGWALQDVACLSIHGRPLRSVIGYLQPNSYLIILSENKNSPSALAKMLREEGFGTSQLTVMEHLNGPKERIRSQQADQYSLDDCEDLNLVAIHCLANRKKAGYPCCSGLPDDTFLNDGQLTKQDVRAVTMAHLSPKCGEVLWDVGAGCGSISVEWARAAKGARAYAVEKNAKRQEFILKNADHIGAIGVRLIKGEAPLALQNLEKPDAIFIGGGFTRPDLFDYCWDNLKAGGRLVANAVTLETTALLQKNAAKINGRLIHLALSEALPLGNFHVWRSALPITMMIAHKPFTE